MTQAPTADGRSEPRLLIAPDSFKGTFSADQVAEALAEGARAGGWTPDTCPVADGGEGTMAVLLRQFGGERRSVTVSDPLGARVRAEFGLLAEGRTAVIETAEASGLALIEATPDASYLASTAGTGELIVAARRAGALDIWVAVGGSATTDGGAGALEAIAAAGGLDGASLTVLCDVTTPFEDAAIVYGPQKGADPPAVTRLTERLHRIAEQLPRDPRGQAMTGCAGGLSGALWSAFDAVLARGAVKVLEAVRFESRLQAASAVVTGEGRLDPQSLNGKITGEVIRRSVRAERPIHAVVGSSTLDPAAAVRLGLTSVTEASTRTAIIRAGATLAPPETSATVA